MNERSLMQKKQILLGEKTSSFLRKIISKLKMKTKKIVISGHQRMQKRKTRVGVVLAGIRYILYDKVGSVFPMVIWFEFRIPQ